MNGVGVILWFVVVCWREPQAWTWMAIRRGLEKVVPLALFSLIKWITAAKTIGWSSTLLKKMEYNFFSELFLAKKKETEKKSIPFKKYVFFQLFRRSLSLNPGQTGNVLCIKVVSGGCCCFFPCHYFIKTESNQNSGVECKSYW